MLILSRQYGEQIVIEHGDKVVHVTVLKQTGKQVKIGIEAPPEVSISRGEPRKPPKRKK